MAIVKRSDADVGPQPGPAEGSIAVEEAPAAPAADPAPPAPQGAVKSMAETLPAALEPELRRIIDTAVARVAAIELEAIHEARELTQRSEKEAREALRFALDRAFNLIATLELLAATVSGMADALKIELDDAIGALRKVPEPESELAKELAERTPAQEAPTPEPEPTPEPPPTPEPAPVAAQPPTPAAEPAPAEPETPPVTAEEPVAEQPAPESPPLRSPLPRRWPPPPRAGTVTHPPSGRPSHLPRRQRASRSPSRSPSPSRSERTVVRAAASQDGGMVPTRRRGLMRRLFAK